MTDALQHLIQREFLCASDMMDREFGYRERLAFERPAFRR